MKIICSTIVALFLVLFCIGHTQAQEVINIVNQPPIVYVPTVPTRIYSTYVVPQTRTMVYQWVPYIVNRPVVVEHRGLFCNRTYVVNQQTIQWVYQLSYVNP